MKRFEDTHIPVFFSEYGANTSSDGRIFQETRCILSPAMTDTFSGGIVYEFFEGANRYGLVKKNEDGSFEKLQDFENLRESIRACKGLQHSTSLEGPGGEIPTPKKFEMPKRSSDVSMRELELFFLILVWSSRIASLVLQKLLPLTMRQ